MEKVILTLTVEEVNKIQKILSKQPFDVIVDLIFKIQNQSNEQLKPGTNED